MPLLRRMTIYRPTNIPFRIGYQIYFILIGACCFALSLSSYIIFENEMDYYEFIIENWREEPIESVRMTRNVTCNSDEQALANYDWPGTNSGCDCPSKASVIEGQCSSNQTQRGCTDIGSMAGETYNFPGIDKTARFQICAKRAQNESFYYNLPRKNECENGYLKCGDEEDYFYCTKNNICPILSIGLKEIVTLENQETAEQLDSQTLIFTRQMKSQLPIVEFRISEAGVCMRNDERGMTSGRSDYKLMKTKKVDCATDPRFKSIIINDELSFYKINKRDNLPSTLPGYEISDEYKWGLYQRPYILWRMKCRGEEYDDFLDQQISLNHILDNQLNLLIISIIFLAVISIGFSIVSFLNISGYDWPCIKGIGNEESNYIFLMEIIAKLAVQVSQAVIIIKSFSTVKDEIDFLQLIIDIECSDQYVLSQLADLRHTIKEEVQNFNIGILTLFIITTFLDFGIIIFLFVDYLKTKRLQKIQSQNENPIKVQGDNDVKFNNKIHNFNDQNMIEYPNIMNKQEFNAENINNNVYPQQNNIYQP